MTTKTSRVRYTADFLRSTGQAKGGEAHRVWAVVECGCGLCALGNHVAVDQPSAFSDRGYRHIARANLQRVGSLRADRVPQGGFLKLHRGLGAAVIAAVTIAVPAGLDEEGR